MIELRGPKVQPVELATESGRASKPETARAEGCGDTPSSSVQSVTLLRHDRISLRHDWCPRKHKPIVAMGCRAIFRRLSARSAGVHGGDHAIVQHPHRGTGPRGRRSQAVARLLRLGDRRPARRNDFNQAAYRREDGRSREEEEEEEGEWGSCC